MRILWLSLLLACSTVALAASVQELEARVQAEPGNIKARFLLGKAYSAAGDPRKAIEAYNQILVKRRVPQVMFDLAVQYSRTGETEKAILLWLEIVSTDNPGFIARPLSVLTMMYLGSSLHKQGNFEQALAWWRRALEVDPSQEKARLFAGVELFKLDRPKEAAREWLILLKGRPKPETNPEIVRRTLYFLGLAFLKLNAVKKAEKVLDRLLALDQLHPMAQKLKAKIAANQPPDVPPTDQVTKPEDGQISSQHQTEPTSSPQYQGIKTPGDPLPQLPQRVSETEKISIQAEELFLDGLDQKEKGNYEKALFSFLQALDVDPKFTQVYLQVGEVYLHLSRLAPTQAQFNERIQLALQSLEKVSVLAPNTLLAHSAQGKIVQAKKLEKDGFATYHLTSAETACKEGRNQDAFEEFILLLSNKILRDSIFLNIARILPGLNRGNKQDLQFFLEDLAAKAQDNVFVPYLLGMTYLQQAKPAEAKISLATFLDRIIKIDIKDPVVEAYRVHASTAKGDPTDKYLWGSILFTKRSSSDARKALKEYVEKAKSNAPFHADALRKISQLEAGAESLEKGFELEKKEFLLGVPSAKVLFGQYAEKAHADEKLTEEVRNFTQGRPDNGLARFTLAWICAVRAEKSSPPATGQFLRQADEIFLSLLREKWPDAEWHFWIAVTALNWQMDDRARTHLKVSGDILLTLGRPTSARHAGLALAQAREFIGRGRLPAAGLLLKQVLVYDADSLTYYLVKYELDAATGRPMGALWNLVEWVTKALSNPWHRVLVLTDLGLLFIKVLLLTLLGAAFSLTLRYLDPLHHFFGEYLRTKGLVFSLPLAVVVALVFLPTGLLIVFPLLTWSQLTTLERRTYLALIMVLMVVPLLMPFIFEGNFQLIRMAEQFRSGYYDVARPYFEQAVKANEYDYVARYLLGQTCLREGKLDLADGHFTKLYDQNAYDVGVMVNLAVVKARKGDHQKAKVLLSQAVGRQTADLPALYDMMAICQYLGQQDKAAQYLKWTNAVAKDSDQLLRYQAFSSDVPTLVLMDHPIDAVHLHKLFSFFSTANFFAFNSQVLTVLAWVLAGGGLLAWLIFLWQRLDFVLYRCALCLAMVCNHCLKSEKGRTLCDTCFSGPQMDKERQRTIQAAAQETHRKRAVTKALVANLILPGSGLYLAHWTPVGAFLQAVFLLFFLPWWHDGGILLGSIYASPDIPILKVILWLSLATALGIYALAQLAFRQVQDEIRVP